MSFIAVSGIIGAGKSTLTKQLEERGWKTYYEPVETNPYLEDFYQDMTGVGFKMQMYLLAQRFRQHQEVVWDPAHRDGLGVAQDRSIYEDVVFARLLREAGHIDQRDYDTYISHFNVMKRYLVYPDAFIYLYVHPEVAHERINARRRECEREIPIDYLYALSAGYTKLMEEMARYTTVLTVDWNRFRPAQEVLSALANLPQAGLNLRNLAKI